MDAKISDTIDNKKVAVETYDKLELYLKIYGDQPKFKEWNAGIHNVKIMGWQAGLIRDLLINRMVIAIDKADAFVQLAELYKVDINTIRSFLLKMQIKGWLKTHKEPMKNTKKKSTILASALQPEQFLYQIIVHEEEE